MVENAENSLPLGTKSTRRSFIKWSVGSGVAAIGAIAGTTVMPSIQKSQTYFPNTNLEGDPIEPIKSPSEYGLKGITSETLYTSQNEDFLVWYSDSLQKGEKTLLLFPGSVGHLGNDPDQGEHWGKTAFIQLIQRAQSEDYQIIAVNHVGFSGSKASPSEAGLFREVETIADWALNKGLKPRDLSIMGSSMGTTLAAYAAKHLSEKPVFKNDKEEKIQFLMVGGVVDASVVIHQEMPPVVSHWLESVWWEKFDTKQILNDLGNSPNNSRIRAINLRGREDAFTPADQVGVMRDAGKGIALVSQEVSGTHMPDLEHVMNALKMLRVPKDLRELQDNANRGAGQKL